MFGRSKTGSKWTDQAAQTQAAFRAYFELVDPEANVDSANELNEIKDAVTLTGEWRKKNEWRISTWMQATIKTEIADEKQWFPMLCR
jgi:hypothetical protein